MRSRNVVSRTNVWASGSESYSKDCGEAWVKVFHMHAKTGLTPRLAYRLLSNDRVSEQDILSGHFQATRERFASSEGPVLVLQDTTTFSYQRDRPELIGVTGKCGSVRDDDRRRTPLTGCGMLMHSSLAGTTQSVPLGVAAVKFWTRSKFKGCNALKKTINPTRVPIEEKESYRWLQNLRESTELFGDPQRCVHIGDRESDIYELFCTAQDVGTHFLVRTCVDRLAGNGEHTIADEMDEACIKGLHRVQTTDNRGRVAEAVLEIRYRRISVLPPIGKQSRYPALRLTMIHAQERTEPIDRQRIEWKLITDLPVTSRQDAIEKLDWYAMRWKIETFHKILKSGCKAEESRLRTADRLANLVAIFCILSWRIFWITMINRAMPDAPPELVLTQAEIKLNRAGNVGDFGSWL
nr:IS4 family transposase [Caballeronia humi]